MNRYLPLLLSPFLLLSGACQKSDAIDTTHTTSGTMPAQATTPAANENMALNARDNAGSTAGTPLAQGNSPADLEMTQRIRQDLVADNSLSNDAKNVKVITSDGVVTLRGPVKSEAERAAVETKARRAAGSDRIEDELDVASQPAQAQSPLQGQPPDNSPPSRRGAGTP